VIMIKVSELKNLPQAIEFMDELRLAAPDAISGEANVTISKMESYAKGLTSEFKRGTGQYKAGIIPQYALRGTRNTTVAELHAIAPHSWFVEAGTGRRGASTVGKHVENYMHGSVPGMSAFNIFGRAIDKYSDDHRERVAAAIAKEAGV
jgi:hypothetical protein